MLIHQRSSARMGISLMAAGFGGLLGAFSVRVISHHRSTPHSKAGPFRVRCLPRNTSGGDPRSSVGYDLVYPFRGNLLTCFSSSLPSPGVRY